MLRTSEIVLIELASPYVFPIHCLSRWQWKYAEISSPIPSLPHSQLSSVVAQKTMKAVGLRCWEWGYRIWTIVSYMACTSIDYKHVFNTRLGVLSWCSSNTLTRSCLYRSTYKSCLYKISFLPSFLLCSLLYLSVRTAYLMLLYYLLWLW